MTEPKPIRNSGQHTHQGQQQLWKVSIAMAIAVTGIRTTEAYLEEGQAASTAAKGEQEETEENIIDAYQPMPEEFFGNGQTQREASGR